MNENSHKQFEIAMEGATMRALLPRERKYTFEQSHQLNMQTGLIGYLRADFGTNGNEFGLLGTKALTAVLLHQNSKQSLTMSLTACVVRITFLTSEVK